MTRLKDDQGGTKKSKFQKVNRYVKALFVTILGSKVLAENCDRVADKYNIDKSIFADAVYDVFEICVKTLE